MNCRRKETRRAWHQTDEIINICSTPLHHCMRRHCVSKDTKLFQLHAFQLNIKMKPQLRRGKVTLRMKLPTFLGFNEQFQDGHMLVLHYNWLARIGNREKYLFNVKWHGQVRGRHMFSFISIKTISVTASRCKVLI